MHWRTDRGLLDKQRHLKMDRTTGVQTEAFKDGQRNRRQRHRSTNSSRGREEVLKEEQKHWR